jgi:hypothetical protein
MPAAASDRPKRWNSHRASSEFSTSPPAKASMENRAARRMTMPRDSFSGAGGAGRSWGGGSGRRR